LRRAKHNATAETDGTSSSGRRTTQDNDDDDGFDLDTDDGSETQRKHSVDNNGSEHSAHTANQVHGGGSEHMHGNSSDTVTEVEEEAFDLTAHEVLVDTSSVPAAPTEAVQVVTQQQPPAQPQPQQVKRVKLPQKRAHGEDVVDNEVIAPLEVPPPHEEAEPDEYDVDDSGDESVEDSDDEFALSRGKAKHKKAKAKGRKKKRPLSMKKHVAYGARAASAAAVMTTASTTSSVTPAAARTATHKATVSTGSKSSDARVWNAPQTPAVAPVKQESARAMSWHPQSLTEPTRALDDDDDNDDDDDVDKDSSGADALDLFESGMNQQVDKKRRLMSAFIDDNVSARLSTRASHTPPLLSSSLCVPSALSISDELRVQLAEFQATLAARLDANERTVRFTQADLHSAKLRIRSLELHVQKLLGHATTTSART